MAAVAIQRLSEGVRATLVAHFLALPLKDRRLRFGTPLAPPAIAAYVAGIDFDQDAAFGVYDERLALAGLAHVAFESDLAEVGLSVLPGHRRRGIARALFARAVWHARNRCVPRLFMHYQWANAPIMHIAQRFGMDIIARAGEVRAHLQLPPASLASLTGELLADAFAQYDRALKALVAAWKQQRPAGRQGA